MINNGDRIFKYKNSSYMHTPDRNDNSDNNGLLKQNSCTVLRNNLNNGGYMQSPSNNFLRQTKQASSTIDASEDYALKLDRRKDVLEFNSKPSNVNSKANNDNNQHDKTKVSQIKIDKNNRFGMKHRFRPLEKLKEK